MVAGGADAGVDHAGGDLGHPDALRLQLDAQAARHRGKRVLGRAVDQAELIDLARGDRGHDDDVAVPAPHHRAGHQARDAEGGQHVGAEHRLAILVGHFQERRVLQDAGVVDEEIGLARRRGKVFGEAGVVQVPGERLDGNFLAERFQLGGAAAGGDDLGAGPGERHRASPADTGARARDQHLLAGQRRSHALLQSLLYSLAMALQHPCRQDVAPQLSGAGHRQLAELLEALGQLVVGHLASQKFDQLCQLELGALFGHHA